MYSNITATELSFKTAEYKKETIGVRMPGSHSPLEVLVWLFNELGPDVVILPETLVTRVNTWCNNPVHYNYPIFCEHEWQSETMARIQGFKDVQKGHHQTLWTTGARLNYVRCIVPPTEDEWRQHFRLSN